MNTLVLVSVIASLACIAVINQNAFGFEPKIPLSKFSSLVTLSGCDVDYLVKNCSSAKVTLKQVKGYSIKLSENLTVDSNDKKPKDTKIKKEKTKSDVKSKKADVKKDIKLKKPEKSKKVDTKKDKSKKVQEKTTKSKTTIQSNKTKTKYDTAKNSINNIR